MKKLEEVLEECLSAYLEQGRPVEESLQLYPEFRGQLEPLLRTAIRVSDSFLSYDPPLAVQQRGLARFLSDARGRARLNSLREESRRGWLAGLFSSQGRLGFAGAGVAAALILAAAGFAAFSALDDDGGSPEVVRPVPGQGQEDDDDRGPVSETPAAVTNLESRINSIKLKNQRGEVIDPAELDELSQLVRQLTSGVTAENKERVLPEVQELLNEANALVAEIADDQPETQPAVTEAETAIRDVASVFDLPLPAGTPPAAAGTPGPTPVAGAAPTGAATAPATVQPTPEPTPEPTPAPTPEPTPTDEAREPQVPVFP